MSPNLYRSLRRGPLLRCAALGILGVAALQTGCSERSAEIQAAAAPPAVVVVPARRETVREQATFVGRVAATDRVELRARVEGFLKARPFAEGQLVQAGDTLFEIEPDRYRSVVSQREADLAAAIADEQNARAQLARGDELLKSKNIAASKVDELRAAAAVAGARIAQAEAALAAARLDLSYTTMTSPISGRIGLARYSVGNLVGPSSEPLAVVVSTDPVEVRFPVTQRELLLAKRDARSLGGRPDSLEVRARLPDDSVYEHPGRIDFVDVVTDPGTDTVTLRAVFPNPDRLLVDGQYVGVTLQRDDPVTSITVPQSALQIDQQGTYVLVVDADRRVGVRRIETGADQGASVAVTSGLAVGDLVVVEGSQKVRPGMEVAATPSRTFQGPPSAAPAAEAGLGSSNSDDTAAGEPSATEAPAPGGDTER